MTAKQDKMYERIRKHGETINDFFGLDADPVKLCKALRRLEVRANKVMVDYCNGVVTDQAVEDFNLLWLLPRLKKLLGEQNAYRVYVNHDPRGYTLKLNELDSARIDGYKDWGGYFIFAPDFSR